MAIEHARRKQLAVLCADAATFLMIYGDRQRRPTAATIHAALQTPSETALLDALRFLRLYYRNVVDTELTGADGLDMDEAYAARLSREIQHWRSS